MKGVYAVFFNVETNRKVEIGALGEKEFEKGLYVYIGSAMNSMESRVSRHFSRQKKLHWHIDYFSMDAEPVAWSGFLVESDWECILAETATGKAEPVDGFGSSDCDCNSHLFRVSEKCLKDIPERF